MVAATKLLMGGILILKNGGGQRQRKAGGDRTVRLCIGILTERRGRDTVV